MYLYPATEHEVESLLRKLPNKNSSGHDNISNTLLKALSNSIITPLTVVFNKSLEEGEFPLSMKKADVVPLYKSKRKDIRTNYRPISLLLTISKLLEKVMYRRTYNFIDSNGLLFKSQYGFRSNHSCEHAVGELVGNIVKNGENSKHTIAIFLDLSKAFDTISHNTLLRKLYIYGIRGKVHDWFKHYLQDRSMHVKCNAGEPASITFLDYHDIEYRAPQGSCLGPLPFMIFVNDLYLNLTNTDCILFADDTTIYMGHRNLKYLEFCVIEELKNIADWFQTNHLTLNLSKTVGMLFTNSKHITSPKIQFDSFTIPFVECTKFLGMWINHKLDWSMHVNNLCLKLRRNENLLKQSRNFLTKSSLKMLYYAQIYSHLTYGLSIWGPMISETLKQKLQRIQTSCLHHVFKENDI